MPPEKIDMKDRKILFELELNARIPETKLAKKVGMSREVVAYRLKKLEERGVIIKYHTIINSMNLGKLMFRTYFKLQKVTPEKEQEIFALMKKHFYWVVKVRGAWDIATMVFADSHYKFNDIMNVILSIFGEYIENYWVSTITHLHHCKRGYIVGKEDNTDIILHKTKNHIKLDEIDRSIVNCLKEHSRASYREISRICKVNEKLVRDRIKRLIKQEVILGFVTFLNISKFGMIYYKLHFNLNDKSQEIKRKMIAVAIRHPNIPYIVEGIGCADLELEVQVKSSNDLYRIIDLYRTVFKENIRDYSFMEYVEEYSFVYS